MNIKVNGSNKSFQGVSTVADLLHNLQLPPENVVVELNTSIIQPESYSTATLAEGDQVEIIRFVGGG